MGCDKGKPAERRGRKAPGLPHATVRVSRRPSCRTDLRRSAMFSISRTATAWLLAGGTIVAAGCAGDDGTAPGTGGPLTGSGRVTISLELDSIRIGQSRQLTARVVDQQGAPSTAEVQWSSAEPTIASVTTAGLVTAITTGTAHIIARS